MSSLSRFVSSARLLLGALMLAWAAGAVAGAPQQKTQVPGYYRMMLGSFEVVALYDGYIDLDSKLLRNLGAKEIQGLLARMFVEGPKVQTAVNGYLVNTGSQLVLVDAGAAKRFGPSLGYLTENLKAAGYEPGQVDAVLLTHLHGDHVNGLLAADGKLVFPNAQVWVSRADADFWLDPAVMAKAPQDAQAFFRMAQDAVAPYRQAGRLKTFAAGEEPVPGFVSLALPGHTPGHSGFLVGAKGERLLVWGDIVHNAAVQFARPEAAIEFDTDKTLAVATRKRILARAAKERLLVAGMHLPFPGIGHVRAQGKGYAWVPIEFGPVRGAAE